MLENKLVTILKNLDLYRGVAEAGQKIVVSGEVVATDKLDKKTKIRSKAKTAQEISVFEFLMVLGNKQEKLNDPIHLISLSFSLIILNRYKARAEAKGRIEPRILLRTFKQAQEMAEHYSRYVSINHNNVQEGKKTKVEYEFLTSFAELIKLRSDLDFLSEIRAKVLADFTSKPELLIDSKLFIEHSFDLNNLLTDLVETYSASSIFLDLATDTIYTKASQSEVDYLGVYDEGNNLFLPFMTELQAECIVSSKSRYNLFDDVEYQHLKQVFQKYIDFQYNYSNKAIPKSELGNYYSLAEFIELALVSIRLDYYIFFQQLFALIRLVEQDFLVLDNLDTFQLRDDFSLSKARALELVAVDKKEKDLKLSFPGLLDYYQGLFREIDPNFDLKKYGYIIDSVIHSPEISLIVLICKGSGLTIAEVKILTYISILARFWARFGKSNFFEYKLAKVFEYNYNRDFPTESKQIPILEDSLHRFKQLLNHDLAYLKVYLKSINKDELIPEIVDNYLLLVVNLLTKLGQIIGEVPVAALVYQEEILSLTTNLARNLPQATAHAEILAINKACQQLNNERLSESLLVVSLEPCTMCSGAISHARVKRVLYPQADTKAGAMGGKYSVFRHKIGFKPEIEHKENPNFQANLSEFFASTRQEQKNQKREQKRDLFILFDAYLKTNQLKDQDLVKAVSIVIDK